MAAITAQRMLKAAQSLVISQNKRLTVVANLLAWGDILIIAQDSCVIYEGLAWVRVL